MSNSRSKSRHNKSLQKFIGDSVSTHRPSNSMVEKVARDVRQESGDIGGGKGEEEKLLYEVKKLETVNCEL